MIKKAAFGPFFYGRMVSVTAKKRRYSLFVIRWQLKTQTLKSCNQHRKNDVFAFNE